MEKLGRRCQPHSGVHRALIYEGPGVDQKESKKALLRRASIAYASNISCNLRLHLNL